MALYPSRSKVTQSQDIWHILSVIRISKGKDPNINIVNGIQHIKGKTYVNILVSNYTNKHIMFNKGEYIGHLEPTIEEIEEEKKSTLSSYSRCPYNKQYHNPMNNGTTS